MYGEGDSDILALVHSSWDDAVFVSALPVLLASLVVEGLGEGGDVLVPRLGSSLVSRSSVEACLAASTPGPWRLSGSASLDAEDDGELVVSGGFTVWAGPLDAPVRVLSASSSSLEELSALRLVVSGRALLQAFLGSPDA